MVRRLLPPPPPASSRVLDEENLATPRYLVNLKKWEVKEYDKLAKGLKPGERVQYGIISYTWGKWRDENRSAEGKPKGIRWDVPYVKGLSLEHARKVMLERDIDYFWWDWVCVPQKSKNNPLTTEERETAGQEIAKQMGIYRGAVGGMVWLHRIDWGLYPLLATFLAGSLGPRDGESPRDTMIEFFYFLRRMQEEEPWLTSGWTLQEGVLLPDTVLLDYNGHALYLENVPYDMALVSSISASINPLAIRTAKAFMDVSVGKPLVPEERIRQFISESDENYKFTANFLGELLRSGLVGYGRNAPLFILTGRVTRRFSREEDRCWAVLGAVEIEVENPEYYDGEQPDEAFMDRVYTKFFYPLLEKYQWTLLLLPRLDRDESGWELKKWQRRIGEGHALPLEIYFQIRWLEKLPHLTLVDDQPKRMYNYLKMEPNGSEDITFIDRDQEVYCRRYTQNAFENGFVRVEPVVRSKCEHSLFLRIGAIEPLELHEFEGGVRKGYRCVEISRSNGQVGRFLGVADVWSTQERDNPDELFQYTRMSSYKLL